MSKHKPLTILMVIFILLGCAPQEPPCWYMIYRHDKDGNGMSGHKSNVIDAARNGLPIRIGFGWRSPEDSLISVEHLADAQFVTISNSREVFVQVEPIIGQVPDLESDTLNIKFREGKEWALLVGTNGFSDRITYDLLADTLDGHRSLPTSVSWFVFGDAQRRKAPAPLYD